VREHCENRQLRLRAQANKLVNTDAASRRFAPYFRKSPVARTLDSMELTQYSIIAVPAEDIGQTSISELFSPDEAAQYMQSHPLSSRCELFVARDAGDNLIVVTRGRYQYWDHLSDRLIDLGESPADFVIGEEE